jgi:hypothetical protein
MSHVPMCKTCGSYEIGTFQVHDDFCSDLCVFLYERGSRVHLGWRDDDEPSMYAGTYSED